jgi:hypothetical protein
MTLTARHLVVPAIFAVAAFAVGATALSAPPSYQPSAAQRQAELTCLAQDMRSDALAWELCLSHVTRAYEWDEPSLALQLAHAAGNARWTCRRNGVLPGSGEYRTCIDREIQAQSQLLVLGEDSSGINVAEVH